MNALVRRLRGLLAIGLGWGALWGAIGAGIGVIVGMVTPETWLWANPVLDWALGMGAYGIVSGIGFGGLLALREGRKTVGDLSLGRVAAWGVLGAAAVPPLFGLLGTFPAGTTVWDVVGAVAVTGFLGGTFATSSVAIAQRAELEAGAEPRLVEAGE